MVSRNVPDSPKTPRKVGIGGDIDAMALQYLRKGLRTQGPYEERDSKRLVEAHEEAPSSYLR